MVFMVFFLFILFVFIFVVLNFIIFRVFFIFFLQWMFIMFLILGLCFIILRRSFVVNLFVLNLGGRVNGLFLISVIFFGIEVMFEGFLVLGRVQVKLFLILGMRLLNFLRVRSFFNVIFSLERMFFFGVEEKNWEYILVLILVQWEQCLQNVLFLKRLMMCFVVNRISFFFIVFFFISLVIFLVSILRSFLILCGGVLILLERYLFIIV